LGTFAMCVNEDVDELDDTDEQSDQTEPASESELPEELENWERRGERWCPKLLATEEMRGLGSWDIWTGS